MRSRISVAVPSTTCWMNVPRWVRFSAGRIQSMTPTAPTSTTPPTAVKQQPAPRDARAQGREREDGEDWQQDQRAADVRAERGPQVHEGGATPTRTTAIAPATLPHLRVTSVARPAAARTAATAYTE